MPFIGIGGTEMEIEVSQVFMDRMNSGNMTDEMKAELEEKVEAVYNEKNEEVLKIMNGIMEKKKGG